jgi:hypothetical protein
MIEPQILCPPRRFAAFILTHGRPDKVYTYATLRADGYTGDVYFIVDNEDRTVDRYREKFGSERVIVFDKKAMADRIDEGNNFDNRKVIVHARNASFDIAESLGLTHFIQLDDDYNSFLYRNEIHGRVIRKLDLVFDALLDFFDATPTKSIALSQGGDHIGGFTGLRLSRKAMNSFICSPRRRFEFVGSINEDVNTYVLQGSRGDLFFTFTGLQLNQMQTQAQAGGMTDIYLDLGTYIKSFTTVLFHPSSVRASMLSTKFARMHHVIDWGAAVPRILSPIEEEFQ